MQQVPAERHAGDAPLRRGAPRCALPQALHVRHLRAQDARESHTDTHALNIRTHTHTHNYIHIHNYIRTHTYSRTFYTRTVYTLTLYIFTIAYYIHLYSHFINALLNVDHGYQAH